MLMWKAGVIQLPDLLLRVNAMRAEPDSVTVPFLSIVGGQEGPVFLNSRQWNDTRRSTLAPRIW